MQWILRYLSPLAVYPSHPDKVLATHFGWNTVDSVRQIDAPGHLANESTVFNNWKGAHTQCHENPYSICAFACSWVRRELHFKGLVKSLLLSWFLTCCSAGLSELSVGVMSPHMHLHVWSVGGPSHNKFHKTQVSASSGLSAILQKWN